MHVNLSDEKRSTGLGFPYLSLGSDLAESREREERQESETERNRLLKQTYFLVSKY